MASFTAQLNEPQRVTGYRAGKASTGEAIGGALSGLANLLDVGLKASAQDREDQAVASIDQPLFNEVQQYTAPKVDTPLVGELTPEDKEASNSPAVQTAADQINKISGQLKQGRASRDEALARMSSIVQRAVNENPRFAEQIRKHAQDVIGFNPLAQQAAVKIDADKALEEQNRSFTTSMSSYAAQRGVLYWKDGQPDYNRMAVAGIEIAASEAKVKNHLEDLQVANAERDALSDAQALRNAKLDEKIKIAQLNKSNEGTPITETERQGYETRAVIGHGALVFNQQWNSFLSTIPKIVELNAGLKAPEQEAYARNLFNRARSEFKVYMHQTMDGAKSPFSSQTYTDIDKWVDSRFEPYADMFNGDFSNLKNKAYEVAQASAIVNGNFQKAAPMAFALKAAGMSIDPFLNEQVLAGGKGSEKLTTELFNFTNKEDMKPTAEDNATHTIHVASGQTTLDQLPNDNYKRGVIGHIAAQMKEYEKDPNSLTEPMLETWANFAANISAQGLVTTDNPEEAGKAAAFVQSPSSMRIFDRLASVGSDKTEAVARGMIAVNLKNIQDTARILAPGKAHIGGNPSTRNMGQPIQDVNYRAVYNPEVGRVEITATSTAHNKPELDKATGEYKGTPLFDSQKVKIVPKDFINKVNSINKSLAAISHLQEYGSDTEKSMTPEQLKQDLIKNSGIPLKPGAKSVEAQQAAKLKVKKAGPK